MVETLSPRNQTEMPSDLDGLPIDAESMFANHQGVYKPRIEKKQRKLVKKLPFLKEFLDDDEKLLLVTTAVSPTPILEQLTTGLVVYYIKRCILVVTNKRIFHIPTRMNYQYRQSIAQIHFGDVASAIQRFSKLKIEYKSGIKELFLYVRGSERKKMRAILPALIGQDLSGGAGRRVHLCPRCTGQLEQGNFFCPNCQLEFKSRKKALLLSILLPGGGYFYTRHPWLGFSDALFELLLILVLIGSLIPTEDFPQGDPATAIFIGGLLAIEKLVTVYHANHFIKEFLTRDKKFTPAGTIA